MSIKTDEERAVAQRDIYKHMTSLAGRVERLKGRATRLQDTYTVDQTLAALVAWVDAGCPATKAGTARLRFWAEAAKEMLTS